MKELRDILRHFDALRREGGSGVLASVVRAEGSTYRRPGARMLVLPDERTIGAPRSLGNSCGSRGRPGPQSGG